MKTNLDKKSEEVSQSSAKSETTQNGKEDAGTDSTGEGQGHATTVGLYPRGRGRESIHMKILV